MRTKGVFGVILAFGVAFALLAGSGIGATIFGENPSDAKSGDALDDLIEDSSFDESEGGGLDAEVGGDDEPTLVGIALSAGQFAVSMAVAVALLPITLMGLGFPMYFAVPVGGTAQILAFIGVVQFVRGVQFL